MSQTRNNQGSFKDDVDRSSGSPFALVLTKTMDYIKPLHAAWAQRCHVARNHIREIPDDRFKVLLGERYEAITDISADKLDLMSQSVRQMPPLSSNINTSNASSRELDPPTRRKIPSETRVIVIDDSD